MLNVDSVAGKKLAERVESIPLCRVLFQDSFQSHEYLDHRIQARSAGLRRNANPRIPEIVDGHLIETICSRLRKFLKPGDVRDLYSLEFTAHQRFLEEPGTSIHEELVEITRAGMSPCEAFATSTTVAAGFFGEQDEFETVHGGVEGPTSCTGTIRWRTCELHPIPSASRCVTSGIPLPCRPG